MKNLDKLEIGRVYTYKELCALFEEDVKTSNSKTSQLKIWECYFRWSNPTKQKYRIEEIYEVPLVKVDGRKQNGGNVTSKYLALDDTIMEYMSEHKEVSCTLPQFAVEIGILSEQYGIHRGKVKQFCENNSYSFELVNAFFEKIRSAVIENVKTALERLDKDHFIYLRSFIVLVLVNGGNIELSVDETAHIVELENDVLKQMGITRADLYSNEENFRNYNIKVNKRILDTFGYDTSFHYKTYEIRTTNKEYCKKSEDSIGRLTRKFIITIGIALLKYTCVTPDDKTTSDLEQETSSIDILNDIIELANYFFVHMNPKSWDEFWNDSEVNWKNEERSMLFWSQYCLVKMNKDLKKRTPGNNNHQEMQETELPKRNIAIAELGKEAVLEFEYILGELDWERCYVDEDYTENCGKALEAYYDMKDNFIYAKDKYIEEFCLYFSRMTRADKESEIIPFYEFVQQFE